MKHGAHPGHGASRALLAGLAHDFAPGTLVGARLADETGCVVAVLLAIAVCHLLGTPNVGWAAFSAYMVIRASFAETLRRGCLRVLGTAVGVALACLLAPGLLMAPASLSVALALAGGLTLYLALLERSGYGWLFAGLSFAMVLMDGMEHTHEALGGFARTRFIDVFIGTCASVLVSAVATLIVRRAPPASKQDMARFNHKAALRHALQGAIALALIPWLWAVFHVNALSQSAITIMVVMMVPMAHLVTPGQPAATRLRHRFFGAAAGGVLATVCLVLSHETPLMMTLAVCLGLVVGRHIENGRLGISYAGTQFALAFLVVLVPDSYARLDLAPGLERLFGILLGMALLEPVRLLLRQLVAAPDTDPAT